MRQQLTHRLRQIRQLSTPAICSTWIWIAQPMEQWFVQHPRTLNRSQTSGLSVTASHYQFEFQIFQNIDETISGEHSNSISQSIRISDLSEHWRNHFRRPQLQHLTINSNFRSFRTLTKPFLESNVLKWLLFDTSDSLVHTLSQRSHLFLWHRWFQISS